jgi:hypothetical protein
MVNDQFVFFRQARFSHRSFLPMVARDYVSPLLPIEIDSESADWEQ